MPSISEGDQGVVNETSGACCRMDFDGSFFGQTAPFNPLRKGRKEMGRLSSQARRRSQIWDTMRVEICQKRSP